MSPEKVKKNWGMNWTVDLAYHYTPNSVINVKTCKSQYAKKLYRKGTDNGQQTETLAPRLKADTVPAKSKDTSN